MFFLKKALTITIILSSLGGAYGKLDLSKRGNVAVYWGQNSYKGSGDLAQKPLSEYCDDDRIDSIQLAFVMAINGPGGAPQYDFQDATDGCENFPGTGLKNCPKTGDDITTCQEKGKAIILSIGGATYSEGGFQSESAAKAGADLIWETFGPAQSESSAYRPFGNASVDGIDFDFEANVYNMAPFASRLRELADADQSKEFFLTAAPQCPYPDLADKEILNGPVSIDVVFVQFYNNFCGASSFTSGKDQKSFNFQEWDNWAKKVSQNPNAKVLLGVPTSSTASSTGYVPVDKLDSIIQYSKSFDSFAE